MGTNTAPLLADVLLYIHQVEFIQTLLSAGMKQLASRFNYTNRYIYIDDVKHKHTDSKKYRGQVYPVELEIKDTKGSFTSASYLDLQQSIRRDGQFYTSVYDKRDDFNFHITNVSFLSIKIPSSPAYGVII